jgi:transposase
MKAQSSTEKSSTGKSSQKSASDPLIVGIDWADSKHDLTVIDDGKIQHLRIQSDAQAVCHMVSLLNHLAAGRNIAVCLEKGRVGILHHLMLRENIVLYPIDPKQVARYRESFCSSGAKDDHRDSYFLARLLAERRGDLCPIKPDDPLTRRLSLLCQTRRQVVDEKTAVIQRLIGVLKMYHPLLLDLPGTKFSTGLKAELLRRYADPRKLRKAHPKTLEKMFLRHRCGNDEQIAQLIEKVRNTPLLTNDAALIDPLAIRVQILAAQLVKLLDGIEKLDAEIASAMNQHPDAKLFTELPGAGAALAPRLLSAFGSDRDRWATAAELGSYTGILPVTRQSGKTKHVSRRRACPKYLRQTFHEFADFARKYCDWSAAYYALQRSRGMKHHAALRKLASRWQRILLSVWRNRVPYDDARYSDIMKQKTPEILNFWPQAK